MDWYAFAAMAQRVLTGHLPGTDGVTPFVTALRPILHSAARRWS